MLEAMENAGHAQVVIIEAPPLSQAAGALLPAGAVLCAPDAARALACLDAGTPATLLIDLPEAECLETLRALSKNPALCVLVHLRSADERFIVQALQAGAAGFITHPTQIAAALRALQEGTPYLPPGLARDLVRGLQHGYDLAGNVGREQSTLHTTA